MNIQQRNQDIVSLLKTLVSINTEHKEPEKNAPYGKEVAYALDYVLNLCENQGMQVKKINSTIGWAQIGCGTELIGIPIHLDVVPAGSGWNHNPYKPVIIDGIMYGRGVMDNKISAAIFIILLKVIQQEYGLLNKRIRLIFGTDEETGMSDMRYYIDSKEEIPTEGFVPDAMYPLINGEKGRLHICLSKENHFLNEFEICGGTQENVVPANAHIIIGNQYFESNGISAHASSPEKGDNAISKLLKTHLEKLKGYDFFEDVMLVYQKLCLDYYGTEIGINTYDDIFKRTTVNLGTLAVNKKKTEIHLDIRYGRSIDKEIIIQKIKESFKNWYVDVLQYKPLHYVSETEPIVTKLLSVYEKCTGEQGTPNVMGGGTYASLFPNMVAFGPKFPSVRTGAHGKNEHVSLENIYLNADIYYDALLSLLDIRKG